MLHVQQTFDTFADGHQSEVSDAKLVEGHPEAVRHVVLGAQLRAVRNGTAEEEVEGVNHESGVFIEVGDGEAVFGTFDGEPRLFAYLPCDTFLSGLVHVDESPGEVECSFGRVLRPSADEQFSFGVEDEGDRGCAGIEVVGKSAVGTLLGFGIAHLEVG